MSKPGPRRSLGVPQDRFRSLFEQSMDAVYIGTPDGAIIDVNQAWLDLFGYERDDLASLNALAFYADPTERADFVRRMNETGFVKDEVRYRKKDGSVFDCQRVQAAMRDADGNVVAYQGVIRDITAQKKAEEALGVELAWRRILLEQSRDGIVVLDQDGKVAEANLRFAEMLGRSPKELLQLHVWDWDVPHPEGTLKEMVRTVDESGDHFETQHRRKDGTVYDVEISTNAAVFGKQKLVFCVCRDITERKRVQKALEQSEASLRFLTEHTADIIWTMDMELRTTYMSPSVERVLGFTVEEWMRLRFDEVATPESVSRECAELQRQLALEASGTADPNRTLTLEIEMYHKNGSTVWMELVMRAIRDDAGRLVGMVGVSRDITERRKTIAAMRESEERLAQLARHSRAVAWEIDLDGLFTYVSPVVKEVLGSHPDDLVGKRHFYDLIPAEGREEIKVHALSAIRGGANIAEFESQMVRADGRLLWVAVSGIPLRSSDGALVSFRGWVVDITARKTAELTVSESEERFSQLAEQSRTWAWEVDFEGLYTYVDRIAEQVIGYRPEELVGKKYFYDLNPEAQREEFKTAALQIIQSGGELAHFDNPVVSKDGRHLWFSTSGIPLRGDDGHVLGYRGWDVDITAQRQVALALGESEARFRSLFEQSWDAIYVGTPEGIIIDVNQSWLDLFGYSPDELSHITVLDLYADPSDRSQFLRHIATEGRVQDEVRYKKKDGAVFDCERTVVVRTDARGRAIAYQGIFRDVSQRNRDQAELERLARFDALTGLLNRRVIFDKADEWIVQTRRYKGHLSVVMLDIDHFKSVNDRYGHQVGDRVLTETAGVLQRSVRQTDFVGRYGGEEFLLILPQTDAAGAAVIAERARIMLQGTAMHDAGGGTFGITASLGVAEWHDGDNVDALVGSADAALYRAKEAGRNRVEVAPIPGQGTPQE